jgi:hypothetical protein
MTAVETIDLAQTSVDRLQSGLDFAQNRLDQADAVLEMADRVSDVTETVVLQARGVSRKMLICGAVALVVGVAAVVIIKKRKQANDTQESDEA